mmetsp:Transcript_12927/g.17975  ORF Transcript_12927/g.17975 Transcript_12927/m.17975 type:complete len:112 (-) Transcript_12927:171-506(-)
MTVLSSRTTEHFMPAQKSSMERNTLSIRTSGWGLLAKSKSQSGHTCTGILIVRPFESLQNGGDHSENSLSFEAGDGVIPQRQGPLSKTNAFEVNLSQFADWRLSYGVSSWC